MLSFGRRAILVAVLLPPTAGGCATPPGPMERAARRPILLPPAAAGTGDLDVLPEPAAERAAALLRSATERGALPLADAFALAEAVHEPLLALDEARLRALLDGDLALASVLPSLSLLVDHDRQDPVSLGGAGSFNSSESVRTRTSIRLTQPLFDGFRAGHARRAASGSAEALAATREDLRRGLRGAVARAFFEVLGAEAEARAREEALRLDDARLEEVRARAAQGLSRRTEVLLLESRREATRADIVRVTARRDEALVVLGGLLGEVPAVPLVAGPEPAEPLPTMEEVVAGSLRGRAELRAADARVRAAEAEVGVRRAARWPRLDLAANWYVDRANESRAATETLWDVGFLLEVPLYRGGAVEAAVRAAESRVREARLDRAGVLRRVAREAEAARVRAASGIELLAALESNERFARENLALVQAEYREGLATNLEVFTAQNLLQDAAVGLERQHLQVLLDRVELDLAMGRLDGAPAGAPDPGSAP